MRIEYERYFSGALDIPPGELKDRVAAEVRGLRDRAGLSSVDRFRLSHLEARFNSYNELFNRRMREQEEGRDQNRRKGGERSPRLDPRRGIVVAGEAVTPAVVEALYAGLAGGGRTPQFDLDTFKAYLARQHRSIREKTGCQEIRFRLADENGKTKLKVKPLGTAAHEGAAD